MVHTGSVAKVQGEGKQWLTKHGNLPEGFSICPVHTGMNLTASELQEMLRHLPRTHGDEPTTQMFDIFFYELDAHLDTIK